MDTDQRTSSKRRFNEDGSEYTGTKRVRFELNKELRLRVLTAILVAHKRIQNNIPNSADNDINLSENITSLLLNCHTKLRQLSNMVGTIPQKVTDSTIRYACNNVFNTVTIPQESVELIWKGVLTELDLKYERNAEWIGIISPMFAFMAAYKLRRQELRIGHSDIPFRKVLEGNVMRTHTNPVSEYGLCPTHNVLLEGITYPPNIKSMMAQSLGPMTSLICLAKVHNTTFSGKWETAVTRDLANLPDVESVVSYVRGKRGHEVRQLFRKIADILLITGSRNASRAHIPACVLLKVLYTPLQLTNMVAKNQSNVYTASRADLLNVPWQEDISFSGRGMFHMYQRAASETWTVYVPNSATDVEKVKQIYFHSFLGTYKEDLSILKWMTNSGSDWFQRNQLNDTFGPSEKIMHFKPYSLRYYSKLCSAQPTNFLGTSSSQYAAQSTFAGYRDRIWTEDFFKHLDSDVSATSMTSTRSIQGLTVLYADILSKLRIQIEKTGRRERVGTVGWKNTEGLSWTCDGPAATTVPTEEGRYFVNNSM